MHCVGSGNLVTEFSRIIDRGIYCESELVIAFISDTIDILKRNTVPEHCQSVVRLPVLGRLSVISGKLLKSVTVYTCGSTVRNIKHSLLNSFSHGLVRMVDREKTECNGRNNKYYDNDHK